MILAMAPARKVLQIRFLYWLIFSNTELGVYLSKYTVHLKIYSKLWTFKGPLNSVFTDPTSDCSPTGEFGATNGFSHCLCRDSQVTVLHRPIWKEFRKESNGKAGNSSVCDMCFGTALEQYVFWSGFRLLNCRRYHHWTRSRWKMIRPGAGSISE